MGYNQSNSPFQKEWIQGVTEKPGFDKGGLHRALGVPEGEDIPCGKLKSAWKNRKSSDMVDSNPSTAHMWTKVFDSMAVAGQAIVKARSTPKAKAEHQEKRVEKRNKRGVKKGEGTIDAKGVYTATAGKEDSKFNTRTTKIEDKAAENRANIGKNSSNDVLANAYKKNIITLEQYKSLIA